MRTQAPGSTTVTVSRHTHRVIKLLANKTGLTGSAIVEQAIEEFRRRYIIAQSNEAYATMHADPNAWAREFAERSLWESTISNGIEEETW